MLFRSKTVAFCGFIDPERKTRLLSFLKDQGAHIVIWSDRVDILLVGEGYTKKYKYKCVKGSMTKIVPHETISIPTIQTNLWVDQYKPRELSSVIGHRVQIDAILSWLDTWPKPDTPRTILVTGPPGIGKTTVVHLAVKHANYDVVELNEQ